MQNKKRCHQQFENSFFRPARTVFEKSTNTDANTDIEETPATLSSPETEEEFGGIRKRVTETLEDKDRRIAELEAMLATERKEKAAPNANGLFTH